MPLAPSCLPRIAKVSGATGCTLTALSIKGLTPGEFEALSNKEIDLTRVILNAAEAKMLGVQERGLSMLLKSAIKNIKPALSTVKVSEQSISLPYIQRTQRSVINANYFTIESGQLAPNATGNGGDNSLPAHAREIVVNLGSSWLKSDVEAIERYFLPGNTVIVLSWDDSTNKNATTAVFEIISAVNADAGGVRKAKLMILPNITATAFAALSADAKKPYQPTFGVVQTGVNSISDREAWCYNPPSNLSRKILVNWLQTTRFSRIVDETYQKTLEKILAGKVNDYQSGFVWNSLAEQNKQMAQFEDEAFVRSAFYGQRLNEKQTPETYDQLPTIADPADPSCPLEYKANAIGFFQMLVDCQRVVDLNGGALNLDYIHQQLYYLKRYREADGDNIGVIDSMTDRWTYGKIYEAMAKYYKGRFGVDTIRYAKVGEKITHDGIILFNYALYDIPDVGVQWAVFHDPFFDDQLAAFPSTVGGQDFKARARGLWFLDWSDIKVGIAGTKSVTRKQPDAATNELYKCVITPNVKTYNLRSQKWTCMLDRPQRHLLIHNFSDAVPTSTYIT